MIGFEIHNECSNFESYDSRITLREQVVFGSGPSYFAREIYGSITAINRIMQ